ncbi:MAG: RNA-binding S4 domain-containing protein [Eubacteriales bacterium]|nr:RNA-binding S4 domain-containing protein [Eubacteriales bacterium]
MQTYRIRDEHIKLGQALKASGLCGSGVEAKFEVQAGKVKVNGAVETARGKKLVGGDLVEYNGQTLRILSASDEQE